MQSKPTRYSIIGRLMWLPLFSAPSSATATRIFLPATLVGIVFALFRDVRAGIASGLIVWIIACWIFSFTYGRSSQSGYFWRAAAKYPEAAYQWFTAESCWHIGDSPPSTDWTGPFRLYVPSVGRMIRIYGRSPDIEESQQKFLQRVRDHEAQTV
jgi:hypothetical protein